jgi:hypothetical protein
LKQAGEFGANNEAGTGSMIKFALSDDRALIGDYYSLRKRCYRRELGLVEFDGAEEPEDVNGSLMIAHRGGQCVGGARIASGFAVAGQLPDLQLPPERTCVWERLVLRPECRTVALARQFCDHLVAHSRDLGFEQAIIYSSLKNARFYRLCHAAIGVNFEIVKPLPEQACGTFKGLEHYLSIARLQSSGEALQLAA